MSETVLVSSGLVRYLRRGVRSQFGFAAERLATCLLEFDEHPADEYERSLQIFQAAHALYSQLNAAGDQPPSNSPRTLGDPRTTEHLWTTRASLTMPTSPCARRLQDDWSLRLRSRGSRNLSDRPQAGAASEPWRLATPSEGSSSGRCRASSRPVAASRGDVPPP